MASCEEVAQVWAMLNVFYSDYARGKSKKQLELTLNGWCEMFRGVDAQLLRYAAKHHITRCKYFPAVSELIDAAAELVQPEHVTGLEAWGEVQQVMRRGRSTQEFSDPLIEHVVSLIGWRNLCMSEAPWAERARFIEAYERLVQRERSQIRMLPEISQVARQLRMPSNQRYSLAAPKIVDAENEADE